jgi:hypothetical protein
LAKKINLILPVLESIAIKAPGNPAKIIAAAKKIMESVLLHQSGSQKSKMTNGIARQLMTLQYQIHIVNLIFISG